MLDKILFILCLYCIYVNENIDPNFYDLWMILWNEWRWKRHQLLADTTAYHGFIQEPQTCMTNHRPFRTKKGLCVWLTHHEAFQNLNANLAFIRFFHLKGRINKKKVEQRIKKYFSWLHPSIQSRNWTDQAKGKKEKPAPSGLSIAPWQRLDIQDTKNCVKVFLQIRGGQETWWPFNHDHLTKRKKREENFDE